MSTSLSPAERGALGGRKAQSRRTPEERREIMRKARLAQAVKTIVDSAPSLDADTTAKLRAIFGAVAR